MVFVLVLFSFYLDDIFGSNQEIYMTLILQTSVDSEQSFCLDIQSIKV